MGTKGRADQKVEWASMHHDPQNTGNYHHPLVTNGPVPLKSKAAASVEKRRMPSNKRGYYY